MFYPYHLPCLSKHLENLPVSLKISENEKVKMINKKAQNKTFPFRVIYKCKLTNKLHQAMKLGLYNTPETVFK